MRHNRERRHARHRFCRGAEDVDYQARACAKDCFTGLKCSTGLHAFPETISVLPSNTAEALFQLTRHDFVARLGNGLIYHDGRQNNRALRLPNSPLMARVKKAYDPNGIFPEYTL